MLLKNKFFQSALLILVVVLGFLTYDHIFDIRLSNLKENLPHNPDWQLKELSENEKKHVSTVLNQTFTYQSEGGQSYVFSSADNQYVLKLFKYKRFRPAWFVNLLPNIEVFKEFKTQHISKRAAKLDRVFMGHKVAYDHIQQESALLFVQLNPSHISKKVKLIDKVGFSHEIDLGTTAYVLQKKGEMLRRHFAHLLKKNQVVVVKERISQVFTMYLSEYRMGIHDEDHGVMQNFGFIGKKPFHLDLGKFSVDENFRSPKVYQPDLVRVANRINNWMEKYYSAQAEEVRLHMEKELSQILQKPFTFAAS